MKTQEQIDQESRDWLANKAKSDRIKRAATELLSVCKAIDAWSKDMSHRESLPLCLWLHLAAAIKYAEVPHAPKPEPYKGE